MNKDERNNEDRRKLNILLDFLQTIYSGPGISIKEAYTLLVIYEITLDKKETTVNEVRSKSSIAHRSQISGYLKKFNVAGWLERRRAKSTREDKWFFTEAGRKAVHSLIEGL